MWNMFYLTDLISLLCFLVFGLCVVCESTQFLHCLHTHRRCTEARVRVFIKQWVLLPEKAKQIMLHELTTFLTTDGFDKDKRTTTCSIVLQYISQNDWNSFQYSQWRKVIKSICVWPLFLYSFPDLWVCWVWVSSLNKSLPCFHSMSSTLKFPAITAHPTLFSLMSICVMLNPPQRPLDENKH